MYWSAQSLYRIPVEGGSPVEIASSSSDVRVGWGSISPDGGWVAYRYIEEVPKPVERLAVIPATGGKPIETFHVPGDAVGLEWAPDGKGLQYLLTRHGVTNVWEQKRSGGDPRQVTDFREGQIYNFSWTRDGHTLLVAQGETTQDVVMIQGAQ